mmetsp:Transcript_8452/g.17099  ORF Transcript_8452/g.17099 Transcript_8452/m.17099 type:complete len:82 (+) Transcript_8452:604-849(+)
MKLFVVARRITMMHDNNMLRKSRCGLRSFYDVYWSSIANPINKRRLILQITQARTSKRKREKEKREEEGGRRFIRESNQIR